MTDMNPKSKDTQVSAERCPPRVPQYWINRLIQARGDERKQAGIVEMMSFAGYLESVIRAAHRFAQSPGYFEVV